MPPPLHAIVRAPSARAAEGLRRIAGPDADAQQIAVEHKAYVEELRAAGLEVTELPPLDDLADAYFVEDAAVLLGEDVAVLTAPSAPSRQSEVDELVDALPQPVVERISAVGGPEARLEGGDVLIASDRVLIGVSSRTNVAGARALARILARHRPDWPVSVIRVSGVLHLKSGMTEVTPGLVLRAIQMRPPADVFALAGMDEVELRAADAIGANVLPLGAVTLVPEGVQRVANLASRSAEVVEVPLQHIGRMDGGLTCLSLRW